MPNRRNKLLIVDDEPATRLLLWQIFTDMGLNVVCAEDGFAALQQIKLQTPDILLSDLNMPGMSGFELLSVVRRRYPSIYVIATSGAYSGSVVPDGIAADAFYEKATGMAALFQLIETAEESQPLAFRKEVPRVPIWVSLDKVHSPQGSYLAITCPECLRVVPSVQPNRTGVVHEENCIYCGATIHFATVLATSATQPSDKTHQVELAVEMSTGTQALAAD